MSDFLANLVARSVSQTAVVRPHVISIFEPPPAEGGVIFRESATPEARAIEKERAELPGAERLSQLESLWGEAPEQRAVDIEPLLPEARAATHIEPSRLRPVVDADVARPKETEVARACGPLATMHRSHASQPQGAPAETLPDELTHERAAGLLVLINEATASRPAGTHGRHDETSSLHEGGVFLPEPAPATPVRSQQRAKSPSLAPIMRASIPAVAAEKHSGAQPEIAGVDVADARLRADEARNGRAAARGTRAAQPQPALAPGIEPAQSLRAFPIVPASLIAMPRVSATPAHGEGATEATTIHVSIGRVEVRATPPPATVRSRPQPAAASVMSLDEYLRQRAAGGRR